jgi:pSer/pThr/pTyr-binding forkhead associated (FHA) protein
MGHETVIMRKEPPTFGYLIIKRGPRVGAIFQLKEDTTLGRRGGNDIRLEEEGVSNDHARIRLDGSREFVLIDLGSTNGTTVNGERAYQQPLNHNDLVVIGPVELVFKRVG